MMKMKVIGVITLVFVLGFVGMADADTVELDLFSLGCPTEFDFDSPPWTSDFDLGVPFSQIDHVYIDWAGEITAGLAIEFGDPDNPIPAPSGVYASLGSNPWPRLTEFFGGSTTYPDPKSFDETSEIELSPSSTWSDLLDGQGTIGIGYTEIINVNYIQHGSVTLTEATLVVDGIIVPEPSTILLISLGGLFLRRRR